jgi:glycine/D-amino acid oxidase-like deaminating enzyme/nitrite reductase/ring-hydroxylating ferredoxin subunit
MDQQSGSTRSVWVGTALPQCTPLEGPTHADVCVIGAGIAGLTTAYCLARAGRKVLVLEAGSIGGGESGRTTAHLSNALDDRYSVLEQIHGAEAARLAAQSHTAAIDRIERIVNEERIECAFRRLDGYLFRGRNDTSDVLNDELAAASRAGLDVVLTATSMLPGLDVGNALLFANQAQFHPLKYLAGVARAVIAVGGRICTGTRVRKVEDGAPARVITANGHMIAAESVVVATNSPISDRLSIHTKQAAYRTYAIALAAERGGVPEALLWDTEDPYHYVRTYIEEGGRSILIVGGEDHKTGQSDNPDARFASLESWTREFFPWAGALVYRWSGQVIEPVDHLAFIGRDPHTKHVYIATGDSGHGMTHGTIAGMLITDLILGGTSPWERLYAPNRKSIAAIGTYAKENLNVVGRFAEYITRGDVADVSAILPGSGAVIRRGAKKLAVYRAEDGSVHASAAVCTHAGCLVRWNKLERSWDCPCHGSRFQPDGEVISGPARAPLAKADIDMPGKPPRGNEDRAPRDDVARP